MIIRSQRVPLYQDVVALLETVDSYRYVAICADDDYMSLDYLVQSIDVLEHDSAAVCSAGNYLVWSSKSGTIQLDARDSTEASPVARLQKSFDPDRFNTMFFAVFRRTAMTPWVNFCKGHPMVAPFFDFIHYWSLLAQGTVRCHQQGFYLWTGENWDTFGNNYHSRARYYTDIGLQGNFKLFHDLHFAVEGLHFFLGEHSPVHDHDTRIACAQAVWSRCMARFCRNVRRYPPKFLDPVRDSPEALEALHFLAQPNDSQPTILIDRFVTIIAAFSEQHAKHYAAHVRASLLRANMLEAGDADLCSGMS